MKNKKIIYLVVFLIKNYYLIDFIVIIIFVIFFINLFIFSNKNFLNKLDVI